MNDLYSRQKTMRMLKYEHAIVVGCGGIGNWVALDLALSGCINKLYLIDPDVVEESNLNRTIFEYSDIDAYKVDCVAKHIIRRRPQQQVFVIKKLLTESLVDTIINKIFIDNSYYHSDICIIDCRDDVYNDCFPLNCKLYKVGYDGSSITIDGNPRLTKVFGQRGGSYTVTPSYVGSAQLAAVLVVNDLLYPKLAHLNRDVVVNTVSEVRTASENVENFPYIYNRGCFEHDELGRINETVTFDATDIINSFVKEKHDYVIPNDKFDNLPNL